MLFLSAQILSGKIFASEFKEEAKKQVLALKEQYNIMSVPCMVINDKDVYFGKKDISQIVEILK